MKNRFLVHLSFPLLFCYSCNSIPANHVEGIVNSSDMNSNVAVTLSNLDKYVDAEDATITGNSAGKKLIDNGQEHFLRIHDDGYWPVISSVRASQGTKSIMCSSRANPPGVYTYDRSELEIKTGLPMSSTRIVGFDMYVDNNMVTGNTGDLSKNWLIFSQLWQNAQSMPPIALEFVPGSGRNGIPLRYHLILRNDVTGNNGSGPNPYPIRFTGDMLRNQWVRFVMEFNANPISGAFFKLYQNGNLVYQTVGIIGYSVAEGHTRQALDWRVGIYRTGGYLGVDWPAQQLWFDEMKYGHILADVL